jgi:O-acetyl-ADP-ribose deacetylase (regulator of RNase III)
MITHKKGNIFTTCSQTIVNTINCAGVMGAGIAFEFRLRNPEMFKTYKTYCQQKHITIGKLWIYQNQSRLLGEKYEKILNFPTKNNWKYPSKAEYLEKGLQKFVQSYQERDITSIAFPLLGADKGGLSQQESLSIMHRYLEQCDIPVEIWHFDPHAKDDLYDRFKQLMMEMSDEQIKEQSKLRADGIKKLKQGLMRAEVNSLSALLRQKGIGEKTIEKSFNLLKSKPQVQQSLVL